MSAGDVDRLLSHWGRIERLQRDALDAVDRDLLPTFRRWQEAGKHRPYARLVGADGVPLGTGVGSRDAPGPTEYVALLPPAWRGDVFQFVLRMPPAWNGAAATVLLLAEREYGDELGGLVVEERVRDAAVRIEMPREAVEACEFDIEHAVVRSAEIRLERPQAATGPQATERARATALHESFRKVALSGVADLNDAARRPWQELPEVFAERLLDDLQGRGYVFEAQWYKPPKAPELGSEQIEELAAIEHARWVAQLREAGGRPEARGRERGRGLLVPWDSLPREAREQACRRARGLLEAMAERGFELRPPRSPFE